MKNWQQRWFVLRGDQLFYYKDEEETKPQVRLFLELYSVLDCDFMWVTVGTFVWDLSSVVLSTENAQSKRCCKET